MTHKAGWAGGRDSPKLNFLSVLSLHINDPPYNLYFLSRSTSVTTSNLSWLSSWVSQFFSLSFTHRTTHFITPIRTKRRRNTKIIIRGKAEKGAVKCYGGKVSNVENCSRGVIDYDYWWTLLSRIDSCTVCISNTQREKKKENFFLWKRRKIGWFID